MTRLVNLRCLLILAVVAAPILLAACEYYRVDKDGSRERIDREEYESLRED